MNWMTKIDGLLPVFKTAAESYWVVGAVLGVCMVIICGVIAIKDQSLRQFMRSKMRQFRYCHDCKFNDSLTETCSINAGLRERCGVIDRQAGMDFTVTKN
jgi:hypothetical protein